MSILSLNKILSLIFLPIRKDPKIKSANRDSLSDVKTNAIIIMINKIMIVSGIISSINKIYFNKEININKSLFAIFATKKIDNIICAVGLFLRHFNVPQSYYF